MTLHYCCTEEKKCFTYRNFPHRLLLAAAAGISGSPITLSSVTLTAPGTAHNPATAPQPAVCRPAPRLQFTPKTGLFCFVTEILFDLQQAHSHKQRSIRGKNRSWLDDYLRKALLNLIRQSVASVSARETIAAAAAAAAPPAQRDTEQVDRVNTYHVQTCCWEGLTPVLHTPGLNRQGERM